MARRLVLAIGVACILVVGVLGYGVLWLATENGDADVTVENLEPRVWVNALSMGDALPEGESAVSCTTSVPMPETWQLYGTAEIERTGGGSDDRTFAWTLSVDGTALTNGTVSLGPYESERVTFMDMGDYTGELDPGENAPARLTITQDGETITESRRSIRIQNQSEPPCPDE